MTQESNISLNKKVASTLNGPEIDYFEGIVGMDVYSAKIAVKDEIHDSMPKYSRDSMYEMFSHDSTTFDFETSMHGTTKEHILREKFVQLGMFGFVSWKWINPLSEWIGDRKCLEVMAGRGWLSYGLQQKGIDIIATDDHSWANKSHPKWLDTVTDVENCDAVKSIKKYGKDVELVIMSWPYMDETAYRVLKQLNKVNPSAQLIFIGEGQGGATANDDFYDHFDIIEDDQFYENVSSNYERWWGLHDHILLGKYNK